MRLAPAYSVRSYNVRSKTDKLKPSQELKIEK